MSETGDRMSAWWVYALWAAVGVGLCGIGLALCAGPTLPPGLRGNVESIVYAPAALPIMIAGFVLEWIGGVREAVALVVWALIGVLVCWVVRRRRSICERFARRPAAWTVGAVSLLIAAGLIVGTALAMARGLSMIPTRPTLADLEDVTGVAFPSGTRLVRADLDRSLVGGRLTAELAVSRRDEGALLDRLEQMEAHADSGPARRSSRMPASFEFQVHGGSVVVHMSRSGVAGDVVDVECTW